MKEQVEALLGSTEDVGLKALEKGIVLYRDECLMQARREKLWHQFHENTKGFFSDEEMCKLTELNCRLIELQHEVFNRVYRITAHLQKELAEGNRDFENFCVEGSIYVEEFEDEASVNSLRNALIDALPAYTVIVASSKSTLEKLDKRICAHTNWWANWEGNFKDLVSTHDIPLCCAFKELFDTNSTLALEDIVKIETEQLMPHVEINI